MQGPSFIYPIESILRRLELRQMFGRDAAVEIELGCGDGSFLVEHARNHREVDFIGVERLLGRLSKLDRKARREGLTNIRGLRIESSYFLQYLLPLHSARALHIYFPDPWPKRKHRRHRLVNESFPQLAHQALSTSGTVYLRTDDADYFEEMVSSFGNSPLFQQVETSEALSAVMTDFEVGFRQQGVQTLRAAYQAR